MSAPPSPRAAPISPPPRTASPSAALKLLVPNKATSPTSTGIFRRPGILSSNAEGGRRPSIQFVPQVKGRTHLGSSRSSSAQPFGSSSNKNSRTGSPALPRRMSSPPPPAPFRPSVSFDTFSNKEASNYSLTLNRKHRSYEYTKRSRTFLCGTDTNDYSDTALEWLIDELIDDGDEIVCLRVVEKDSKEAIKWGAGMGEKGYRREAERMIDAIALKNTENRAISLVLEFAIGKVHDTIQQMIRIYEPALLVVGTRGRSLTGYQGLLSSGSVSKYCLQYSPVPVIVVRPSSKREAKKDKRLRNPTRMGYRDILDKSDDAPRGRGGHLLDAQNRSSLTGTDMGALGEIGSAIDPDHEARMVAEAIGYKNNFAPSQLPRGSSRDRRDSSLSRTTTGQSEDRHNSGNERLMQSPLISGAGGESPNVSDDDEDLYDDDYDGPAIMRPEDEALALAYERAQKISEEERAEAEARARRQRDRSAAGSRSASRRREDDVEEGRGAAALGLLAQLDRGIR